MTTKADIKIVMLGKSNAGKTCLVERFHTGEYSADTRATVGGSFCNTAIQLDGKKVTVGVWDTAGAEKFESMSKIYYRGAHAACLCFDVTNVQSWEKIAFWVQELRDEEPDSLIYIVSTKCDLLEKVPPCVSEEEVMEYAEEIGAEGYFTTSAKTGENVSLLFKTVASKFKGKISHGDNYQDLTEPPQNNCSC
eukprot:TRINITY_DN2219_c0_g1_i2.p1 TRINITY_DN2219_c0_g1~~TRINITY_DN2219_c0_g1_i2.p1  ORF type:complete len:216 (-),score=37.32 TRINITY_DN2219_c0_g1_i2:28-606(-)